MVKQPPTQSVPQNRMNVQQTTYLLSYQVISKNEWKQQTKTRKLKSVLRLNHHGVHVTCMLKWTEIKLQLRNRKMWRKCKLGIQIFLLLLRDKIIPIPTSINLHYEEHWSPIELAIGWGIIQWFTIKLHDKNKMKWKLK